MVERRAAGEPLQYVLRRWGFRTLDLLVDQRVLIPRPETEVVVEVAIRELRRVDARPPLVADLGTGSGALAPSVAPPGPPAPAGGTPPSHDAMARAPSPCRSPPRFRPPGCGPPTSPTTHWLWRGPTWRASAAPLPSGCAWRAGGGSMPSRGSCAVSSMWSCRTRPTSPATRRCRPR